MTNTYYRDFSTQMYKTQKVYGSIFYPTVYVIEAWDQNEFFYKIGWTSQNVNRRFGKFPYNFRLLVEIDDSGGKPPDLEQLLQNHHKGYNYLPSKKFGGYLECYSQIDFDFINKNFANLCLV